MKQLLHIFIIMLLLSSCEKEDDFVSSAQRAVISDDESVSFESLTMLIHMKTADSTYLIVESLDSVSLYINNKKLKPINSHKIALDLVAKDTVANTFQSVNKMNYLLMSNQLFDEPEYTTAGDYARYLNDLFVLQPGQYMLLIESFRVTLADGSKKSFYPYEYRIIDIEKDKKSAYVGEIEIFVDL